MRPTWTGASPCAATPYDHVTAVAETLAHPNARKCLAAGNPGLPPEDIVLCLQRDLCAFALRAEARGDRVEAVAVGAG